MNSESELHAAKEVIEKQFGSRLSFLFHQLEFLAFRKQRCDITVYNGEPHIDVTVDPAASYAMMYGAGAAKLAEMLSAIRLSDGSTVSIKEIWTIHPMPANGFTEEELAAVDLSAAEEKAGDNGETIREMVSQTYRCKSREQEDHYLRRYFAS